MSQNTGQKISRTIDQRVVEMRFDNKQFEAGTKETMGTLGKLKEALKFTDTPKGLDNIQKAVNKVDMTGLGNVIDGVKLKFSALEVTAITALSNIVNRATNAGTQLVKSLSIDQVTAGYREYELKMGAIQTIMASTGESLETVNGYLQELNEYSDKTIYSFSDMTQNIGKFTNAGVKLEDAVKAIQGVSNAAAVSGANAEQASHAMYNFAQALSSGAVRLTDWHSIETANMSTVEFRQNLIDTAIAMGTVVKVGDKYQSVTKDLNGNVSELFGHTEMFNMSLSSQWLTTDVLVQALNNYSTDVRNMTDAEKAAYEEKLRGIGYTEEQIKKIEELGIKAFNSAQDVKTFSQLIDTMKESVGSGWAQTFELIFGNFEEAKQLWTNVNNTLGAIIQESSDSRNELLKGWKNTGGRDALFGAISNSFNSLLSIVTTVKEAFRDVFPKMTGVQLADLTKGLRDLTAKLKLSEKGTKNLRDAFKGVFSVIKLVVDGFLKLFKAIIPINKPLGELGGGFLGLIGAMGRGLTKFTEMIRSSKLLNKAFEGLSYGFSAVMGGLSNLIKMVKNFISSVSGLEGTRKLVNAVNGAFQKLSEKVSPYIDSFVEEIGKLFGAMSGIENVNIDNILNEISKAFSNLADAIEEVNLTNIGEAFDALKEKIKGLVSSNQGLSEFVTDFKNFNGNLQEAFTLDNILDRIEKVMDVFGKFFNWIKSELQPAFSEFSVGSAVAAGGGLGLIYAIVKGSKALEKLTKSLPNALVDSLGKVSGVLDSYQKKLRAETILKIAGALAILAGALALLSFLDTKKLLGAALALGVVGGVLLFGINKILEAVNKGRTATNALVKFSSGLKSTMKKFGRAIEIKALGGAVKNFAMSIGIIAASIIALGVMWRKDPEAIQYAKTLVLEIGVVLVAISALMGIVSKLGKGMGNAANSILKMSLSIGLIVLSLKTLFEMKLPEDYNQKLSILGEVFMGLAGLIVVIGLVARISGKNQLPKLGNTVKSLSLLLIASILSLKVLFDMNLPKDYEEKLSILKSIFIAFVILIGAIANAAKVANDKGFKAAGTILALSAFLVVVTGSLFILSKLPTDKMLKGATGLALVLTALAAALYGASKTIDKDASKTVLAMALTIGTIAASLGILSMLSWDKLLRSSLALGGVLLTIAANFYALSKVKSKKALPASIAMIAALMIIAQSLKMLSEQPWEGMLAAGTAMSVTLLAFSKSFETILGKKWSNNNVKKVGTFLLLTLAVAPIGVALGVLAHQPWEGMLAAGLAISPVILAFSKAFDVILGKNWSNNNVKKVGTFLLLTLAVAPIGAALAVLAHQPWDGLLAAGVAMSVTVLAFSKSFEIISSGGWTQGNVKTISTFLLMTLGALPIAVALATIANYPWEGLLAASASLSMTLLALSACFAIISKTNIDLESILLLVAGCIPLLLIAEGISKIAKYDPVNLLDACAGLSLVLIAMAGVMAICATAGLTLGPAMAGIVGISAFIVALGVVVTAFGLLNKIPHLQEIVEGGGELLGAIGTAIGKFIGGIAAAFMGSIMEELASQLPVLATSLSDFMVKLGPFIEGAKSIDAKTIAGVALLSAAIIALTAAEVMNGFASLFGLSLVDLADELSQFMSHLGPFIILSRQLKEESVRACATLAKMVITLTVADFISGIGKFLGISGNLADFGDELSAFAPGIVDFADKVKDVDPKAVEGAAAAAEIMANLAKKLPASDGLVQKILGERSLADFGAELVAFAPDIVEFADDVKDVDSKAVEGAAAAAEIMANLASKLPKSGGLAQTILGDQSLADFGDELSAFAPDIVKFAEDVKDVDPEAVGGAASVTEIMTILANNLPNSKSLGEKLFGGGQTTLSDFGDGLVSFGESMSQFYTSVVNIDVDQLTGAIDSFKALMDLSVYAEDKSVSSLSTFSSQLGTIGTSSVDKFIEAFENSESRVASSITGLCKVVTTTLTSQGTSIQSSAVTVGANLCTGLQNGIKNKEKNVIAAERTLASTMISNLQNMLTISKFNSIGQNIGIGLVAGINGKKLQVLSAVSNLCNAIINKFRTGLQSGTFGTIGRNLIIWMAGGIDDGKPRVISSVDRICNAVIRAFETGLTKSEFVEIGENAALGLKEGIENKINEVKDAAIAAAAAAIAAAKEELEEASPSKKTKELGKFFSIGLANGIVDKMKVVAQAAKKVSSEALNPVKKTADQVTTIMDLGDFNYDPVIRPVVDLSEISNAVDKISSTFDGLDLSTTIYLARSISDDFVNKRQRTREEQEINNSRVERKIDQMMKNNMEPVKTENINTFYIQSTDPKKAAEEVGYIMQRKVERGKAAWAK